MSSAELTREVEALRAKLSEAEEVIRAIQSGDVDAVVVSAREGDPVLTLNGAEYAYRALVEAMNEGAATLGADGTVLYSNQRLSDLLGIPFEQIIGGPVANLVAFESKQAFAALLTLARSGGPCNTELHFEAAQSKLIPVCISLRGMKSVEPGALCMVVTDLTERKQRDEIIAAGRLATSILQSAADAIAVCDENGMIIRVNQALENLCGFNPLFQPFDAALPLELHAGPAATGKLLSISDAMSGRTPQGQEVHLHRGQKEPVPLLLTITQIEASSGVAGHVFTMTDITERKRSEVTLRESEERFRALVLATSDVVYRMSPDWREMRQLIGHEFVPDTDAPNATWVEKYIPAIDQARVRAAIHEAIQTKDAFELEHRVLRVDGSFGWTFSRAIPQLDANGQIMEWFGVASDITARKQAEEALREREAQLATLTNLVPQFVWMCTADGLNVYFNQRWVDYTGMTLEESYGKGWNTPFHPDDKQAAWEAWNHAVETGSQYRVESRLRAADGTYRWFLVRGESLQNEAGAAEKWFGTCTDIEDIKQAEQVLRESEARFRSLFENSLDAMFLTSPDGQIQAANPASCALFYMSEEELCRVGRQGVSDPDDPRHAAALEHRQRNRKITAELSCIRKDGTKFAAEVSSVVLGGVPPRSFVVMRDITERKQAEQALLRSEKLASVGRMASTIAHEINNPLEAIGNALYLALTGSKIADDTKSYLDMAVEELDRVSHITRQTLAFHHQTSTPTQVDLRQIIDGALKIFGPRLKARGVIIARRTPPVGQILGFASEIQQIISNLLCNSMDAVPNNGRIEFRLSRLRGNGNGRDKVRFTIADTGSGIPPEQLAKVFDPFFTTKEMHGTGLGLWVTKQIVEKHGASIRVRSKPGRGTVFSIIFPVAEQATVR